MSRAVLIGAKDHLAALRQHSDLTDAEAFADTDALKALETMARQAPEVIVLEQAFAASARGAAFINRVKANPALASCEIRTLELAADASADTIDLGAALAASETDVVEVLHAVEAVDKTVDQRPTGEAERISMRRAPRVDVTASIEVLIDGNPATLVDISTTGARVVSPSSLRPNQRVRISLLDVERPIRFNGVVAWVMFEMPKEGPRYRAGVDFSDAAPESVARFIEAIKGT